MGKINLLYVVTKLELGGAQKHVITLIKHLDNAQYNTFLFTAKDGLLMEEALSIKGLFVHRSKFLERSINPFKDILAFFEIVRFIHTYRIEIVHTHSSKAGVLGRLAARVAGVKAIIHTIHGWSFNEYQPLILRKVYVWLEIFLARCTDQLIVVSESDKIKGLEQRIGTVDRYRLIRLGIERNEFLCKDQHIRKTLGIAQDDLVVGMIACLKPQKAPEDFIMLAALLRQMMSTKGLHNLKFLLVGDGALRSRIEKLIAHYDLGENVIMTGWRYDIPKIVSAFDIFVLTSLWEGLPLSVLEAMAAGVPVVVTNTAGVSEIIREGENGFMVSPGSVHEMAMKVALLLEDTKLRIKIGKNAQATLIDQFATGVMVHETAHVYDTLLKQKGRECVH